ncbi:MAG TPA: hypothetical protein VGN51_07680 [Acidimicrobiia bacterium]
MDASDDTIRRFVVHLYTYDPERRERRNVEVGSFDDETEALQCFGQTHLALKLRQTTGESDAQDNVSMVAKEPGSDERNRRRRIEQRLRRHS